MQEEHDRSIKKGSLRVTLNPVFFLDLSKLPNYIVIRYTHDKMHAPIINNIASSNVR